MRSPLHYLPKTSIILGVLILFLRLNFASAQTSSNDSYMIQYQELEQKTFKSTLSEPETSKRSLQEDTYEAVLGYDDIASNSLFSLESSSSVIDYGRLYPTNPVVRALNFQIGATSAHGYSVLVSQNHPLSDAQFANLIPDTSCDRGLCSKSISALWDDNLTYGLGYACENVKEEICTQEENNFFKKFPDDSKLETPEPLFQGSGKNAEGKILYKLNISATQASETYSNTTTFILIPNL